MKRPRKGSTIKQMAYAKRMLSGGARSKKEAALLSGFSPTVANNAKNKIENTEGYHNAIIGLATESNNLLMATMAEFKARGLGEFSNKDLVAALNAVSNAWDRIEKTRGPNKLKTPEGNPLRAVFTERVTRTVAVETPATPISATPPETETRDAEFTEKPKEDDPNDF